MERLKRAWRWIDDQSGAGRLVAAIARYPVPPGVASLKRGWWYLFGIGALVALLVQIVTGAFLATLYVPSAENAYSSIQFITNEVTLGRLLRGMHYFGASALLVFVGVHLARVYLTGSYKFPRGLNWIVGVVLLVLVFLQAYTGQLLRWDHAAVASTLIAAEQAGIIPFIGGGLARLILAGDTIGGETLTRFFAFHVLILPGLIVTFVTAHLYLVLRNGISEPPEAGRTVDPSSYRARYQQLIREHGRPYWPEVAWRQLVAGMALIVVIALLALVFGPKKLGAPPAPTLTDAIPKPDWYLLWYYALISSVPDVWEDYLIILGPIAALAVLILLPLFAGQGERSPDRRPWAYVVVAVIGLFGGGMLIEGMRAPWVPKFDVQPLSPQVVGGAEGPAAEGAQLFYTKACLYCHAVKGQGGQYGPNLTNVVKRYPPQQLKTIILRGRDDMPGYYYSLTPAELDAILAFLESVAEK